MRTCCRSQCRAPNSSQPASIRMDRNAVGGWPCGSAGSPRLDLTWVWPGNQAEPCSTECIRTHCRPEMERMSSLLLRARQSAVVWFWATNLLRLGSYFILLPLLGRTLSGPDFGFYWVLVNLA